MGASYYWTIWTREPGRLQEVLPEAEFVRFDRVQPGVEVFAFEHDDPEMVRQMRWATTRLLATNVILHCTRASTPPEPAICCHAPDAMLHHYSIDDWVVTDDRLHRLVNYFKADRCDVMWKYPEVDLLTFDDEQKMRAEVQRRIARYQAEDAAALQ